MIILACLIAISYGCAPSIPSDDPVVRSTTPTTPTTSTDSLNSNITSTSSFPTNTTTALLTTVPTTTTIPTTTTPTPPGCCEWPFPKIGVNRVTPSFLTFTCNETVTVTCENANFLSGAYTSVGILGNYVPNAPDYDVLTITSSTRSITASFTCDTDDMLWERNGRQYSNLTCIWSLLSGGKQIAQFT